MTELFKNIEKYLASTKEKVSIKLGQAIKDCEEKAKERVVNDYGPLPGRELYKNGWRVTQQVVYRLIEDSYRIHELGKKSNDYKRLLEHYESLKKIISAVEGKDDAVLSYRQTERKRNFLFVETAPKVLEAVPTNGAMADVELANAMKKPTNYVVTEPLTKGYFLKEIDQIMGDIKKLADRHESELEKEIKKFDKKITKDERKHDVLNNVYRGLKTKPSEGHVLKFPLEIKREELTDYSKDHEYFNVYASQAALKEIKQTLHRYGKPVDAIKANFHQNKFYNKWMDKLPEVENEVIGNLAKFQMVTKEIEGGFEKQCKKIKYIVPLLEVSSGFNFQWKQQEIDIQNELIEAKNEGESKKLYELQSFKHELVTSFKRDQLNSLRENLEKHLGEEKLKSSKKNKKKGGVEYGAKFRQLIDVLIEEHNKINPSIETPELDLTEQKKENTSFYKRMKRRFISPVKKVKRIGFVSNEGSIEESTREQIGVDPSIDVARNLHSTKLEKEKVTRVNKHWFSGLWSNNQYASRNKKESNEGITPNKANQTPGSTSEPKPNVGGGQADGSSARLTTGASVDEQSGPQNNTNDHVQSEQANEESNRANRADQAPGSTSEPRPNVGGGQADGSSARLTTGASVDEQS
ncbi:hypothetical protein V1387_18215, partial [Allomuricauda taeanensis]|uniref:hypothetical protein n=1 Tax=Flagellimonas taeanensis TaxID=1005926 RepID=UPI002E7B2228